MNAPGANVQPVPARRGGGALRTIGIITTTMTITRIDRVWPAV
ncbi:MAG: hypothetical protein QM601_06410 [Pseudoxanthomonas sp.]